jgi:hypothetical protein
MLVEATYSMGCKVACVVDFSGLVLLDGNSSWLIDLWG